MWAFLGRNTRSCTGLSAGKRWQARKRFGIHLLLTPTRRHFGQLVLRIITAWAAPLPWRWRFAVRGLLLGCLGTLIGRPFLDAAEMKHSPARSAGPDALCCAAHLVCADGTLVVAVVDVLVSAGGDIGSGRLWALGRWSLPLTRRSTCTLWSCRATRGEVRGVGLEVG